MKKLSFFLLLALLSLVDMTSYANTTAAKFMTPSDRLANNATSNINLHNNRNSAVTVYGLYVRQFAYVSPFDTCASATLIYSTTQNTTAGPMVMPIVIGAGESAALGSHYLYNMIYQAIYYENILIPSSPPGCALPGCTWGSDTTSYNWCIYLGALTPVSTSTGYTANVPPAVDLASSPGLYNYDLITTYFNLGPISCNDQTLTCVVASQQTQSFS